MIDSDPPEPVADALARVTRVAMCHLSVAARTRGLSRIGATSRVQQQRTALSMVRRSASERDQATEPGTLF